MSASKPQSSHAPPDRREACVCHHGPALGFIAPGGHLLETFWLWRIQREFDAKWIVVLHGIVPHDEFSLRGSRLSKWGAFSSKPNLLKAWRADHHSLLRGGRIYFVAKIPVRVTVSGCLLGFVHGGRRRGALLRIGYHDRTYFRGSDRDYWSNPLWYPASAAATRWYDRIKSIIDNSGRHRLGYHGSNFAGSSKTLALNASSRIHRRRRHRR